MRFLNPCQTDVTVSAKLIKLGRTLCPVAIDFHDAHGEHVATGQATYIRVANLASPGLVDRPTNG